MKHDLGRFLRGSGVGRRFVWRGASYDKEVRQEGSVESNYRYVRSFCPRQFVKDLAIAVPSPQLYHSVSVSSSPLAGNSPLSM